MPLFAQLILSLGLVGHFLICIGIVNRLHGLPIHRPWFKIIESPVGVGCVLAPLAAFWVVASGELEDWLRTLAWRWDVASPYALAYFAITTFVLVVRVPFWMADRLRPPPDVLERDEGQPIDLARRIGRPTGDPISRLLVHLPGNEVFKLDVRRKQLRLPRMPRALDGLRIAHLTDVHLSGRIGIEYFEQVIAETNALEADVVLATGDYFDREQCLEWIPRTLAHLKAPLGIYFILGNHDWRLPDPEMARRLLGHCRWIDVGSRCLEVQWRGAKVQLAGNELPWFGAAPAWPDAGVDPAAEPTAFRIALLHTPDQFPWACRHQADLVLAGHTHGGQVCLPGIGAVIVPSRFGVKYTQGVFRSGWTVMHVSRGVSGLEPVRWRCLPEIDVLTLRAASTT